MAYRYTEKSIVYAPNPVLNMQHCVKRMKDGAIIFQFPARNFSDNIDSVLNADFTSGLEGTKEPQTVTRKRNVPLHRKHWRTTDIRAFDTGSSWLCVRVFSLAQNWASVGRAATLIHDNRVDVYSRVDGSRGMYTSVTHTRPNEFRVVLSRVEKDREREKTGSVHPTSVDGNGVAHTRTHDGRVVTRRYISKRWKKPIAFPEHEARDTASTSVDNYVEYKLKKFYRIAYPYLNVIDLNSELAVNCTFGHITVQFGDTVKHMHFVHKTAYLQLVRNLDDSSLDPYSPGTCTIRDQLLELPLYEDTTNDLEKLTEVSELLTLLPTTTCLSHTFVVEFSIRARGFLSMQNMPKVSQILQQYNFHRKCNSSYPLRKPTLKYICEKYGDFPIEEIQFKIPKLQRPSELNRDRKYCNLKSRTNVVLCTKPNILFYLYHGGQRTRGERETERWKKGSRMEWKISLRKESERQVQRDKLQDKFELLLGLSSATARIQDSVNYAPNLGKYTHCLNLIGNTVYVKFYAHINETCHCHNGRQSIQRVNDNGSQNRVKLLEFASTSSESRYQTD
ncbi:hypothetical protein G5I_11874 [Acromyrmex echinatior]|uniref:Uncharacterized protein n=1 Tax=Acromyrmex echinatior TaxID=103372 RepID=F4X0S7_ACREC|nr:hypothetical protein G5I_11874 [Acromyrmex echinatior]